MSPKKGAFSVFCTILTLLSFPLFAQAPQHLSKAPANAKVQILEPKSGAILTSPITIKFGIENMTIVPAGIEHPSSGHHHLLVDVETLPNMSLPIPADTKHIHFGKGQTETSLELAPGKHTLQLLLGDHLHRPHEKPVLSDKITITVKAKN